MNKTLLIPIVLLLFSCKEEQLPTKEFVLPRGTFFLDFKNSNEDTIVFRQESTNFKRRNWHYKSWEITEDSIFQDDSRGLSYFLKTDKRKYVLNQDSLFIFDRGMSEKDFSHYRVLEVKETEFQIVLLGKSLNPNDVSSVIRTDMS